MIEILDRIEAHKVARDLEIARATIEELKVSKNKKDAEKKKSQAWVKEGYCDSIWDRGSPH